MQLASTLFAVCIIQIKPQLEKLLRIPDDSLTKEIRLTQDLMELFIKYQIPSDLLSYDGPPNAQKQDKIDAVKQYVKNMQSMIHDSQKKEIQQVALEATYDSLSSRDLYPSAPVVFSSQPIPLIPSSVHQKKSKAAPPRQMKAKMESARVSNISASVQMSAPSPVIPPPIQTKAPPQIEASVSQPVISKDDTKSPQKYEGAEEDYTAIPTELDRKFEILDEDSALRPTIIQPGQQWIKQSQAALLAPPVTQRINVPLQKTERDRTFDLLDALTRSGCLMVDHASLHVIMAATHTFSKTLIDTVIQDNINPIEKVERSALIVATTIHNKPASELVKADQLDRVKTYSPGLFGLSKPVPTLTLEEQPLFALKGSQEEKLLPAPEKKED
jgi:hypothetical protein